MYLWRFSNIQTEVCVVFVFCNFFFFFVRNFTVMKQFIVEDISIFINIILSVKILKYQIEAFSP